VNREGKNPLKIGLVPRAGGSRVNTDNHTVAGLKVEIDPGRTVKFGVDFPSLQKTASVNSLGEIGPEDLQCAPLLERNLYKNLNFTLG
jgi:hypothetical protein